MQLFIIELPNSALIDAYSKLLFLSLEKLYVNKLFVS